MDLCKIKKKKKWKTNTCEAQNLCGWIDHRSTFTSGVEEKVQLKN